MQKSSCFWSFCVIIFLSLFFISCQERKRSARSDIEGLIGNKIHIPNDLMAKYNGLDTALVIEDNIKMLVYYDSIDCSPCLMNQMFEWSDIIYHSESIASPFPIYFIFKPSEYEIQTLIKMLKIQSLDYPVLVDTAGSFLHHNPLLIDNPWKCFLLDRNNRIVLVGSPLKNHRLWNLYKNTIYELISNDGYLKE